MNTRKDLSNISYNTPEWLEFKLNELKEKGKIDLWMFISHKPENENDIAANKKEHIHLMFRPSGQIQTAVFGKYFEELDILHPDRPPLRCTDDWRVVNSFGDWWLYVLHDPKYLKMKHLTREFHYSIDDMRVSDMNTVERMISFIDLADIYRIETIYDAAHNGWSFSKAMAAGVFGNKPQAYALLYKGLLADHYAELSEKALNAEKDYLMKSAALENLKKDFESWKQYLNERKVGNI